MRRSFLPCAWVLVAVCGCGKLAKDNHPPPGNYPVGSTIKDEKAWGGFSEWGEPPKDLGAHDWGTAGAVSVVAFPGESINYLDRRGMAVRVINRTDAVATFAASDSCLRLTQEAIDRNGNWRAIEVARPPICGNSLHHVFLDKNQYWEFPARRYSGRFKTKLRFRLDQDRFERCDPAKPGDRVIYSNEFEGSINESQFVTDEEPRAKQE